MKSFLTLLTLIIISINTMGQNNKHPMKVAMVSVFVEDPSKAFKYYTEILGIPVITFSSIDIQNTVDELKKKGVVFKKDPVKTAYGYEAIFDDSNGLKPSRLNHCIFQLN